MKTSPPFNNPNSPFFVEKKVTDYRKKAALWDTLLKGEDALKAAGSEYLNQRPVVETDELFSQRLKSSNLVNAFLIGVSGWASRITGAGVELSEEARELDYAVEIQKQTDVQGNNLSVFAGLVAEMGIGLGSALILVSAPDAKSVLSKADAKKEGIRPYFRLLNPVNDILGFSEEGGKLTAVRILETFEKVKEGTVYEKEQLSRVREYKLENGKVISKLTVWDGHTEKLESDPVPIDLDYIPLVAFIPGKQINALFGECPVQGLADLTKAHWNSWSLQTNILMLARTPFLVALNAVLNRLEVATTTFLNLISKGAHPAKMEYVEVSGKGSDAGYKHIDQIEAAIRVYDIEVSRPTGNELATTKVIDSEKTIASLVGWATEEESAFQQAFQISADFSGEKEFPENGIKCNKEFGVKTLTAEQVTLIDILITNRGLSLQSVYSILQANVDDLKGIGYDEIKDQLLEESRANPVPDIGSLGGLFEA